MQRRNDMKEFWNLIQLIITALGGWLGYFLGGCDGFLYALLVFVVLDYVTGIMCAINDHKLSSEVGFRGICRKVIISPDIQESWYRNRPGDVSEVQLTMALAMSGPKAEHALPPLTVRWADDCISC